MVGYQVMGKNNTPRGAEIKRTPLSDGLRPYSKQGRLKCVKTALCLTRSFSGFLAP